MLLAIDPAIASMGYCIHNGVGVEDVGVITTSKDQEIGDRLVTISRDMNELIRLYSVGHVAIEKPMFVGSRTNAMPVLMAYGVIIHALAVNSIAYTEYYQASWKKAFTGNGNAKKADIKQVLETLGYAVRGRDDGRDALAIALVHLDSLRVA